jgi:hypothetical protein
MWRGARGILIPPHTRESVSKIAKLHRFASWRPSSMKGSSARVLPENIPQG